jgi:hypothetical protein
VSGWFWLPNTVSVLYLRGFPAVVLGVLGLASRARMRDDNFTENDVRKFFLCEDRKTQQTQHTQLKVNKNIDFKRIYLCWVCVG